MNNNIMQAVNPLRKDLPELRIGDTIRVTSKSFDIEGEKNHHFEGIIIKKHGGGIDETFAVRKISFGVGIERTFHLNSPNITKIELINKGSTKRAKLYYFRKNK